jgi:subtilisin family serine protease
MTMKRMIACLTLCWSALAHGQLLPQLPQLPQLPSLPQVGAQLPAVAAPAVNLRALRVRELLRQNPRQLDRDPRGQPIVRGVFLALSPSAAALDAARAAGFSVQGEQVLDGLEARVVTLVAPAGWSARRGLNRLRQLDRGGRYDFNHLYFESAESGNAPTDAVRSYGFAQAERSAPVQGSPGRTDGFAIRSPGGKRVGLIDGGVATAHPAFAGVAVHGFGCGGAPVPSPHGTAVASLLVGRDAGFHGAAPGLDLYAADVYCGAPVGGLVDAVAQSLAWLAREGVPVINISLVGPANVVLEGVIRTLLARDIVIVAAVGNDGPSARPLYPASYDGVIGVTAVDARDKALLEAGRGPQVDFAAPGADIMAALPQGGYGPVRGTSFAAPLVAGLIATAGIEELRAHLRDLGAKGRDKTYGEGLAGAELRGVLAAVNK